VTQHRFALALIVLEMASGGVLRAQEQSNPSASLQVQVVISRYLGDKKVGSLPYSLSVNPDNRKTSLRIGANVPVATTTAHFSPAARGEKPAATPITSYSYQSIGTNIDCTATPSNLPGNQYRLTLEIEDSSVYPDDNRAPKGVPSLRSFKLSNTLLLKDGQSTQLTSASDKVSGEVLKVDVTLTVVK
jgi:type II/III secretion system protein